MNIMELHKKLRTKNIAIQKIWIIILCAFLKNSNKRKLLLLYHPVYYTENIDKHIFDMVKTIKSYGNISRILFLILKQLQTNLPYNEQNIIQILNLIK